MEGSDPEFLLELKLHVVCCQYASIPYILLRNMIVLLAANRAVEVNEMWRVRQKELELDDRLKGKSRDEGSHVKEGGDRETSQSRSKRRDSDASCSSSRRSYEDHHSGDDDGLKDEEIEKFLHSRYYKKLLHGSVFFPF